MRAQYIWSSIWPSERLRQREFMTFGMEVLLKLDLPQTRDFFSAFFALSDYHWKGFLSSRLSLPELLVFGLSLFVNLEGRMKVSSAGVHRLQRVCCYCACGDVFRPVFIPECLQIDLLATGIPLFPGLIWNIIRAERTLPKNTLGKGEVVKPPIGTQQA